MFLKNIEHSTTFLFMKCFYSKFTYDLIFYFLHLSLINSYDTRTILETPEKSIIWIQQEVTIGQGHNTNVTCRASNPTNFDVLRIGLEQDNRSLTIADNDDVKSSFNQLSRYKVHHVNKKNFFLTTIFYNGILGEDSGRLYCQKLSSPKHVAKLSINVQVPLTELMMIEQFENGTRIIISRQPMHYQNNHHSINKRTNPINMPIVIVLDENKNISVFCIAKVISSKRLPTIKAQIGDEYGTFVQKSSTTSYIDRLPCTKNLVSYQSEVEIAVIKSNPEVRYFGKLIKCLAYTDEIFEPLTVNATLLVKFKPRLHCDINKYKARLGDNITMICHVESYPHSSYKWIHLRRQKTLHSNRYFIIRNKSANTITFPTRQKISLQIARIKEYDFSDFKVLITNELGSTHDIITLSKLLPIAHPQHIKQLPESKAKNSKKNGVKTSNHTKHLNKSEKTGKAERTKIDFIYVIIITVFIFSTFDANSSYL